MSILHCKVTVYTLYTAVLMLNTTTVGVTCPLNVSSCCSLWPSVDRHLAYFLCITIGITSHVILKNCTAALMKNLWMWSVLAFGFDMLCDYVWPLRPIRCSKYVVWFIISLWDERLDSCIYARNSVYYHCIKNRSVCILLPIPMLIYTDGYSDKQMRSSNLRCLFL